MDIKRIIKTIMALIVLSYFNGKYLSAQSTYKLFYGVNYIDPNTFNPIHGSYYLEGIQANELMYSRLWTWTKDISEASDLVENITPKSFNAMRVPTFQEVPWSYKVQLRENLKWPDGEPLTAEDIAFSFNVYRHDKSESVLKNKLEIFKKIKVIDNRTIQFFIEEKDKVNAKFVLPLVQILPKHKFITNYLSKTSEFSKDPMGSGPFQFDWQKNSENDKYSFGKNNYYYKWKNNSNISSVNIYQEFEIISLITKLTKSPRTEDWTSLDLVLDLPNSKDSYDAIESKADGVLTFKSYKSNSWYGIAFNCEKPLLQIPEFRLALTYALDIEQLIKNYAKIDIGSKKENITRRISGPFNQQFGTGDDIKFKPREFSLATSRKLLDDNGITEKDGKRYYNGNFVQPLKLIYNAGDFKQGSVEQIIIDKLPKYYEAIGITLDDPISLDKTEFENRLISGDYDMAFQYYEMGFSSDIAPLFTEGNLQNISRFYDPMLTNYMNRFNNTTAIKQQKMFGDKIHELVYNKAPYIFLYRLEKIMGYRNELVHGNNIVPKYFFTHIGEWYFKDF